MGKARQDAYDELFRLVAILVFSIQMYLQDVRASNDDLTGDERKEQWSIIYETGIGDRTRSSRSSVWPSTRSRGSSAPRSRNSGRTGQEEP